MNISLGDCNLVELPFDWDWEEDPDYRKLVDEEEFDVSPMTDVAIEFAKAVVVWGNGQYRQAFKVFAPDVSASTGGYLQAISLWDDMGSKELYEYMEKVRLLAGTENQRPARQLVPVPGFMSEHDFGHDECWLHLVKGMNDKQVELAKAHSMGLSFRDSVKRVIPSLANDESGIQHECYLWTKTKRGQALHQYLCTLRQATAVSVGPRDRDYYLKSLETMYEQIQDVGQRLKLINAILDLKESGGGPVRSGGIPAGFDTSGLED